MVHGEKLGVAIDSFVVGLLLPQAEVCDVAVPGANDKKKDLVVKRTSYSSLPFLVFRSAVLLLCKMHMQTGCPRALVLVH